MWNPEYQNAVVENNCEESPKQIEITPEIVARAIALSQNVIAEYYSKKAKQQLKDLQDSRNCFLLMIPSSSCNGTCSPEEIKKQFLALSDQGRSFFLQYTTSNGDTALHLVAAANNEKLLRCFLRYAANTTVTNNSGQIPLDMAKNCNASPKIINLLGGGSASENNPVNNEDLGLEKLFSTKEAGLRAISPQNNELSPSPCTVIEQEERESSRFTSLLFTPPPKYKSQMSPRKPPSPLSFSEMYYGSDSDNEFAYDESSDREDSVKIKS
ncbi:MAG: ankyrin repeat domain-containing protein [Gammaproteobacteria bacterium]